MAIKKGEIAARLRAKFLRRDRAMVEINALDVEIKALVRSLSSEQGLITPMRVEQARQTVFGEEVTEVAA